MPEVSFQPPSTSNTVGKLQIDIEGISGQSGPGLSSALRPASAFPEIR